MRAVCAMNEEARALVSLVPPMRRARLWRLYAEHGQRYLDLWAQNGRGVLGARGDALGRSIKASIDKGLSAPLPSRLTGSLEKALCRWQPHYRAARFFLGTERALAAIADQRFGIVRPYGEFLRACGDSADIALAILPCPAAWSPAVLLFRDSPRAASGCIDIEGDLVPPAQLAVAVQSLAEFTAFRTRIDETHWRRADRFIKGIFVRSGPWLYPAYARERHKELFAACLQNNIIISPDYDAPSMIPGDFDDGELKPLLTIA